MSASTSSAPSRGLPVSFAPVPRGEKRRREIALVAEQVFFESGFTDTTMQEIAARAGASKETLYRHFGSKEELFAEIVKARAKGFLESLDEKFDQPGSVADVLRDLGIKLLEAMVEPEAISLCRTVVAETPRNPELGRIFYASGPDRVHRRLTDFLAVSRERGDFACDDPELSARIFLGAIVSSYHLTRLVLLEPHRLTARQVRTHVDEVVALVMACTGNHGRTAPSGG